MPWEIFGVPDLGQKERHKAANEVASKARIILEAFRLLTRSRENQHFP